MTQKLGQLLIEQGILTEVQLRTALRTQEFFGGHLGSILIDLGFVEEQSLGETLSRAAGVRYATPELLEEIPEEVIKVLPPKVAERHKAVPIRIQQKRLHLAMVNPKDLVSLDEIAYLTGMVVVPYVAPEFRIDRALERHYGVQRRIPERISIAGQVEPERLVAEAMPSPKGPGKRGTSALPAGMGFDGLPLDAEVGPGHAPFARAGKQNADALLGKLPRNVGEWRHGAGPAPPPADRASAPDRAPSSTTGPARPTPGPDDENPLRETARRLLMAETREELAETLLHSVAPFFRRRLLFFLQRDRILGWDGRGDDVSRERVKSVLIPMESLSMFTAVKDGSRPFRGPVADLPANRRLFEDLGMSLPPEVVLLPVLLKSRVVSVLYGDNGSEGLGSPDMDKLGRLTLQFAMSLEILIFRNKILSV